MSIAIHTKYLPATNTRGSRIKVYTHRGFRDGRAVIFSVTISYSHTGTEHDEAAAALLQKHWPHYLPHYVGASADGRGFVYVAK